MGDFNFDQFTDLMFIHARENLACLPPGMYRQKISGLDKSLMGCESRGGGGGGGGSHTTTENPYDDAWIHDRFATDQATGEQWRSDAATDRGNIRGDISNLASSSEAARQAILDNLTSYKGEQAGIQEENVKRLLDLEQRTWQTGDIQGLDEQLTNIIGTQQTADEALRNMIQRDYVGQDDFSRTMSSNIEALRASLTGQHQQGMTGLAAELAAAGSSASEERSRIESELAAGQSLSAQQRAALEARLTQTNQALEQEMAQKYSELGSTIGTGLSDLESTFTGETQAIRGALGEGLSELTGTTVDLQNDLSGVRDALGGYREETDLKFRDIDTTFRAKDDALQRQKQLTDQQIANVYTSRENVIGDLTSDFSSQLQQQEDTLNQQIQAGEAALNKRLTDISTTMNYRMLGDSALGIRSRRSKAFREGDVRRGTGQLSRGMRINSLNV